MFKNRSNAILWLVACFTLVLGLFGARADSMTDFTTIVTDSTTLFGVVKTLGITVLAFYIGYRLLRKIKV